jgi:hypothetical protein
MRSEFAASIPSMRWARLHNDMEFSYYLTSLGVIPLFAFRAFGPLLATALVARFGTEWAPLSEVAGIQLLAGLPSWATDDTTLLILTGMTALELLLNKVPEARELLRYSDIQLKAIAAFGVCFYLVEGDPRELLEHIRQEGLSTGYALGQSFAYSWSFGVGAMVWFVATLRRSVYAMLDAIDEEDSLGLQRLLSWMEDAIGFLGVMAVVFFPVLGVLLAGLALLVLLGVRRFLESRERKQMAPCEGCQTLNHLSGIQCSNCRASLPQPHPVGVLGVAKLGRVDELDPHRLRLVANKRCPSCATRLVEKRLRQSCPICGTAVFADSTALDAYLASLEAKLPKTLAICLGLSSVPLVGLIPGILYYRVSLISSLRYYVPGAMGIGTRWLVRMLNLLLLLLQVVPIVGAVTLPLMCWLNFRVYSAAVRRQASTLAAPSRA